MTNAGSPPTPELNLLRALQPATIEIHKALQRQLLKLGGAYRVAPHVHDYDVRPYVMSNPLRELGVKAVLVFPWDSGTGQTLAEFVAYYKFEIPRKQPLTLVVTASPLTPAEITAAEGILDSPICVVALEGRDPNQLRWVGTVPYPPAIAELADRRVREALRDIDPAEAVEKFHNAAPKDVSRQIESNLIMPRRPSSFYSFSLILINVAMYVLAVIKAAKLTNHLSWNADEVMRELAITPMVSQGEYWRLLSAGFMHFGVIHLGMNMYFLYVWGPVCESTFGRNRFMVMYMLSLLGSSLLSFAVHTAVGHPFYAAGASGALMGIFFGIAGYVVAARHVLGRGRVKELLLGSLKYAVLVLVLGLFLGFDNPGHLGGGLAGFAVGYVFGLEDVRKPLILARLRYLLLTLFLSGFLGLFWLALPRAARMVSVSLESSYGINKSFLAFLTNYNDLENNIQLRKAGPLLYPAYDQLAADWQNVRMLESFGTGYDTAIGPDVIQKMYDAQVGALPAQICVQELNELTMEENDLINAMKSAQPPAAEQVQATLKDMLARLQKLEVWPPAKQLLIDSPALRRDATRLATDLKNWQSAGTIPPPPPLPPTPPPPTRPATPSDADDGGEL